MIEMVSKHRNNLYSQAAKLLREYRRVVRLDLEEEEIKIYLRKLLLKWLMRVRCLNSTG